MGIIHHRFALWGWLYALSLLPLAAKAHDVLTLDSCRRLALENNKALLIQREQVKAATYQRKAAFTNYLPKLSASGGYLHTTREISILNQRQKNALAQMGSSMGGSLQNAIEAIGQLRPELVPLLQQLGSELLPQLDATGKHISDAFRTDTRNTWTGALTLTQPLYLGGKIHAYNKITQYAEELARQQEKAGMQDVILSTDEVYWRVVSLANKKELAENYLKLLEHLNGDMEKLVAEGVATKADELTVKVKLNEAEMTLVKVSDGLSLTRMLLCQLCGIPLQTPVTLADETLGVMPGAGADTPPAAEASGEPAFSQRPELRSLGLAADIARQQIRITRSEFLPSLALTGGYLASNPSVFNGFEKKFNGMWSVGVMLQVPLFHWGEGIYKVKAARSEALMARYRLDETREKIELQVQQATFRLNETKHKLTLTERNEERADENLRYARLGFSEGVIAVSNLLEAQTAWLSAHSDRIDAQIDARLARLYLQKSLGTLHP